MAKIRELNSDEIESAMHIFEMACSPQRPSKWDSLLQSFRERHLAYVAEEESGLVGLMCFVPGPVFAGGGLIILIGVPPEHRGRGIGRQLAGFAERKVFQSTPKIFVTVPVHDEQATRFFELRGYQRAGTVKAGPDDGEYWLLKKDSEPPGH